MNKPIFNPCDECMYGIERRDGSGNDSMCKICEFRGTLTVKPPEYKVNPNYPDLGKNHFCASCGVMFIDWENAPTNYCGNCGQKLREADHEDD